MSSLILAPQGSLRIPTLDTLQQLDDRAPSGSVAPSAPLKLSLVIPTFNEQHTIQAMIQQLVSLLDPAIENDYELIVVDDDSPDFTWKLAAELIPHYPQLRVIRRQQERGLSTAVIRGWQVARGRILGVIDGDLQHPPEVLMQLLQAIDQADLAVASRHIEGGGVSDWGLIRRFLSRGAQVLGLLILPNVVGRVSDPMSGYFLVQRQAIAGRYLNPLGYKILLEVLGRGVIQTVAEVGYVFQERVEGESKVTWQQYVEYLRHLVRLRLRGRLQRWRRTYQIPLTRFIQFGVVGLSGVLVDMGLLYLLSDPSTLGWGLTRSKMIASEFAILNNFFWNDRWTFSDLARHQSGWSKWLKRLMKFNVICLAGLVLNVLTLNFLFNAVGLNRYLANLIAIAAVTLWNFWLNVKLNWRVTEVEIPKEQIPKKSATR